MRQSLTTVHCSSRHALAALAFAASALVSPAWVQAAGEPLTLERAQALAVANSPRVAAFGHAADASREMAIAAAQLPDPTLKLGIDNVPAEGPDRFSFGRDFMTMRQVGLAQELTRTEKRDLRARHSEIEAEKSLAERSLAAANVLRDTAIAWLERHYAEAMRRAVDEEVAEARLQVDAADSAYRAGRGSQADVFAARSAVAMLEDRGSEVDRRLRSAQLSLARWLGEDAQRPLAGEPDIGTVPLAEHRLRAHIEQHPEIEMLSRQEELAANEVQLASAARKPDWSVELMYSVRGPGFPNMVSIGFSVPLAWDRPHRQDREVAAKLAMEEEVRAQREDTLRMHIADVGAMLAEWEAGRERIARYAKRIVPLARSRTEAAFAAYRGAKGSLVEVLAARRDELDTRLQALQIESDNARVWAQLAFLIPDGHGMKDMK
jgi:outer membrane protein TolC